MFFWRSTHRSRAISQVSCKSENSENNAKLVGTTDSLLAAYIKQLQTALFTVQRQMKRCFILLAAAGCGVYGLALPTASTRIMPRVHVQARDKSACNAVAVVLALDSQLALWDSTCNQETYMMLKTKLVYSFYHAYVPCKTGFRNSATPPWSEI